jgi:hypothetical protein
MTTPVANLQELLCHYGKFPVRACSNHRHVAHAKQNFVLTRNGKDYVVTLLALEHPHERVVHLA